MVKTAEFRDFDNRAVAHHLALNLALLFQLQMSTASAVIVEVRGHRPLQMTSVQANEMIEALP